MAGPERYHVLGQYRASRSTSVAPYAWGKGLPGCTAMEICTAGPASQPVGSYGVDVKPSECAPTSYGVDLVASYAAHSYR
eukprot:3857530-Rhodomonas_salina.2